MVSARPGRTTRGRGTRSCSSSTARQHSTRASPRLPPRPHLGPGEGVAIGGAATCVAPARGETGARTAPVGAAAGTPSRRPPEPETAVTTQWLVLQTRSLSQPRKSRARLSKNAHMSSQTVTITVSRRARTPSGTERPTRTPPHATSRTTGHRASSPPAPARRPRPAPAQPRSDSPAAIDGRQPADGITVFRGRGSLCAAPPHRCAGSPRPGFGRSDRLEARLDEADLSAGQSSLSTSRSTTPTTCSAYGLLEHTVFSPDRLKVTADTRGTHRGRRTCRQGAPCPCAGRGGRAGGPRKGGSPRRGRGDGPGRDCGVSPAARAGQLRGCARSRTRRWPRARARAFSPPGPAPDASGPIDALCQGGVLLPPQRPVQRTSRVRRAGRGRRRHRHRGSGRPSAPVPAVHSRSRAFPVFRCSGSSGSFSAVPPHVERFDRPCELWDDARGVGVDGPDLR
jgi:hypothetical protein